MVSIAAFQAVDLGSIPGQRKIACRLGMPVSAFTGSWNAPFFDPFIGIPFRLALYFPKALGNEKSFPRLYLEGAFRKQKKITSLEV